MKNIKKLFFAAALTAILAGIFLAMPAQAQLVLTNQKMKIVKVERKFNRLQARVHEVNKGEIQYVLIDGNTRFSHDSKPVSYDQAWKMFREGMIFRVKGGFTMTGKIKAKSIYW